MADSPINVLVIEDNPGDARLIQTALEAAADAEFNLFSADRLSMALNRLASGGIDVVLLDLGLPDSLGLDSFASVHDHAPDVPVVVLSGLDHKGVAGEAVRAGAHFYLVKSQLATERLESVILQAIERQRRQQETEQVRQKEVENWSESEAHRQEIYEDIAEDEPGDSPYPDDVTLFGLCGDYRELTLRYVRAARTNGSRPTNEVRRFARRLAEIRAGGRHVVRLHQRSLSELALYSEDRTFLEDARLMLVELMAALTDGYLVAY